MFLVGGVWPFHLAVVPTIPCCSPPRWQATAVTLPCPCTVVFLIEGTTPLSLCLYQKVEVQNKKTQKIACFNENKTKPILFGQWGTSYPVSLILLSFLPGLYWHLSLQSVRQTWKRCHSSSLFCLALALFYVNEDLPYVCENEDLLNFEPSSRIC